MNLSQILSMIQVPKYITLHCKTLFTFFYKIYQPLTPIKFYFCILDILYQIIWIPIADFLRLDIQLYHRAVTVTNWFTSSAFNMPVCHFWRRGILPITKSFKWCVMINFGRFHLEDLLIKVELDTMFLLYLNKVVMCFIHILIVNQYNYCRPCIFRNY